MSRVPLIFLLLRETNLYLTTVIFTFKNEIYSIKQTGYCSHNIENSGRRMLAGRKASLSQSINIKIKAIPINGDSSKNHKFCYTHTEALQKQYFANLNLNLLFTQRH